MNITVTDFQSIGHAELDVQGLTVIVGPSDRGKSALLRAIEAALFNRPGDQFVRIGAKTATVSLELPARDPSQGHHEVRWTKGGGVNAVTVDRVEYAKVGTKAPKPLQDLGFRDVLIGARLTEEGKLEGGELMRPQVARQLRDRIFLLDSPGPFINETLVQVSRLGVLQRANRLCSGDLRAQKSLLKTRQDDLQAAEAARVALEPVVALRARVQALQAREVAVSEGRARYLQLQGLVAERGLLRARLRPLPPVARPVLPPAADRLDQLRQLLAERARVAWAARAAFPKARKVKKTVVAAIAKWRGVQPLVVDRRQHVNWVDQYQTIMDRRDAEHEEAAALVEALKAEIKVCPTCDRPF